MQRGGSVVVASAGAVDAFTRSMAKELGPIRVNSLSPGLCDTALVRNVWGDGWDPAARAWAERVPVGRIGTPDDIAHAAIFLMTNGYVTGATSTSSRIIRIPREPRVLKQTSET